MRDEAGIVCFTGRVKARDYVSEPPAASTTQGVVNAGGVVRSFIGTTPRICVCVAGERNLPCGGTSSLNCLFEPEQKLELTGQFYIRALFYVAVPQYRENIRPIMHFSYSLWDLFSI